MQWNQIGKRARRYNHPCRVYSGIPHQSLQLFRGVDELSDLAVFLVRLLQLRRIMDRLLDLDVKLVGHHLGDAVHVAVRDIHGAAYIFNRRLGRHGAEGDNLRDIFPPIRPGHIVDDLAAAIHTEVNVNVRHGNAFGIKEPLKQ